MSAPRDLIKLLFVFACAACPLMHSADDAIAAPPLVRGWITGLAVDADGNRYLAGSFYDARDFNPGVGADIKTPAGWGDLYVTRFNADGSYAWTQTVGVADGSTFASGVTVSGGVVYAAGGQFTWDAVKYNSTNNAIVVALDATTGQLKSGFGTNGTAAYSAKRGAMGLAIAAAGNVVYASGELFPDWSIYAAVDPLVDPDHPIVQPTSNTFVWALDAGTGENVAGFGTDGIVTLDTVSGHNSGRSIAVSGDSIFVGGSLYNYDWATIYDKAGSVPGLTSPPTVSDPSTGTTNTDIANGDTTNFAPYYFGTQNAFIASLNATTGALNTSFAKAGIKQFGWASAVTGNGLTVSGGNVYLTGSLAKLPPLFPDGTVDLTKADFAYFPSTDIYVMAVDAKSGAELSGFGKDGVATFGRQFEDQGVAIAADNGTLYVTGGYGNLSIVGGYYYPLAGDGAAPPENGPVGGGPPKGFNDPAGSTARKDLPMGNTPGNVFGLPNNLPGNTTGALAPIWFGGYGVTDAFVLALDASTGAPKTNFSGDGLQTFGGSSTDGGVGIAIYKDSVIVAGYTYSADAGLGGLGKIDATDWYAFLLTLDTATGGGGGAETNTAPAVHTGDKQTVKIPEHKSGGYYYNEFQAWLYPTIIDDGLPNPPGTVTVKWSKVSGPGTVKFEDDTHVFTAASFSEPGVYELRIDASDGDLTAGGILTVVASKNYAPVIDSPPTALANPAATGQDVIFSAAAHDPDTGDWLYYWWDFGDDCYGWDASTTHAFLAPGTYTAVLHVSDGWDDTTAKIKVTFTGDAIFNIDGLQFTVDFAGKKRSTLRLKGTLGGLARSFDPRGATVNLNAGGAVATFTLDKKGRGKNAQGTFVMNRVRKGWKYSAKLNSAVIEMPGATNGNSLGIENVSTKKDLASVPVNLSIGGVNYTGNKTVEYSIAKDMAKGK